MFFFDLSIVIIMRICLGQLFGERNSKLSYFSYFKKGQFRLVNKMFIFIYVYEFIVLWIFDVISFYYINVI